MGGGDTNIGSIEQAWSRYQQLITIVKGVAQVAVDVTTHQDNQLSTDGKPSQGKLLTHAHSGCY